MSQPHVLFEKKLAIVKKNIGVLHFMTTFHNFLETVFATKVVQPILKTGNINDKA